MLGIYPFGYRRKKSALASKQVARTSTSSAPSRLWLLALSSCDRLRVLPRLGVTLSWTDGVIPSWLVSLVVGTRHDSMRYSEDRGKYSMIFRYSRIVPSVVRVFLPSGVHPVRGPALGVARSMLYFASILQGCYFLVYRLSSTRSLVISAS